MKENTVLVPNSPGPETVRGRRMPAASENGRGQDQMNIPKPANGHVRRPSRSEREDIDVVAMMTRDVSYSAVVSAHQNRSSNSSDDYMSESEALEVIDEGNRSRGGMSRANSVGSLLSVASNNSKSRVEEKLASEKEAIEIRQTSVLFLLGCMACLVIVAMTAVSVAIGKTTNDQETAALEKSEDLMDALGEASQEQKDKLLASLKGFAKSLTDSTSPEEWPFVTHDPLFEALGQPTRALNPAIEMIAFSPFVEPLHQLWWKQYSWAHQNWIQDHWAFLGKADVVVDNIAPNIYQTQGAVDNPFDYLAPLWQTSPPPAKVVKMNHDMLSVEVVVELYRQLLDGTSDAVASPLRPNLPSLYGLPSNDDDDGPRSILLLPVKDSLVNVNASTVGLLHVVLNWEGLLQDLIPSSAAPMKATLQNNCGDEPLSFESSDDEPNRLIRQAEYNDLDYDTDTDPMVMEQILGPNIGGCSYSVGYQLLQSTDGQDSHDTAGILVVALVPLAIAVVALSLILFALLQWIQLVDVRHQELLKRGAKHTAIVETIFPADLCDRFFGKEDDATHQSNRTATKKRDSSLLDNLSTSFHTQDDKPIKGINNSDELQTLECYPGGPRRILSVSGSERLKKYLDTGTGADEGHYSAPIADLFPNCTVLFADIAGFTAWSSSREPGQVFTLLETLYKKFDDIAKKRRVFKVETVGDCYVAVTGLPEQQDDHALIMARFARDCMYKSYELTKKLEVTLGPDTAELSMRFGLHSGPVTAGVLRGDRPRFQLFGDTVNTASRMESTGQKGRIQMSQETADNLNLLGKTHLVRQREDVVTVKGKGEMTTYWMALGSDPDDVEEGDILVPPVLCRNTSGVDSIIEGVDEDESESTNVGENLGDSSKGTDNKSVSSNNRLRPTRSVPVRRRPPAISMSGLHSFKALREKKKSKESRLVDWNVDILGKLLKNVIARRNASGRTSSTEEVMFVRPEGQTVLEEVCEIITLPKFDATAAKNQGDPEKMDLNPVVREQLHDYVSTLASMYRDNPFHNYEHASHVTMSVVKLLGRIVAPKRTEGMTSEEMLASELHDHTYGITSDPLTQFAVVLSAVIHDVDHTGVPNSQLVKENARVAAYYKNKSVAEQNSVDMSWTLLMEPQFRELRHAIYSDEAELTRFRSLLVNAVMATDIVDKELKQLRNNRWDKAFSGDVPITEEDVHAAVNRKATIVLEHLIQASDVSHTMQHWHVYRKWNERLFDEMYNAYRAGRAEKDPSEFWYTGEIGFFDFYIIPLAKKLKDCGVFGVSSDEYLNYAMTNREEWQRKGEAVTAEMVAKARDKDLARMERQASVRGPVIAEMKAAVLSMRSPQKSIDSFRQPSFRHLRTEPHATESITMPHHGFRRGFPNRIQQSSSLGSVERDAMKRFRQAQPTNNVRSDISVVSVATAPPTGVSTFSPVGTAMRKPVRRESNLA